MFSKALKTMDRNTVNYIIEELKHNTNGAGILLFMRHFHIMNSFSLAPFLVPLYNIIIFFSMTIYLAILKR